MVNELDFSAGLLYFLNYPSQNTLVLLEDILKDPTAKVETVAEFVNRNPEIKHLQSLHFEGRQDPNEKLDQLKQLCPNISRISLFGCERSRQDFRSIIKWIQQSHKISSLSLPYSSSCWPQFEGLTQISELNIHKWKASDSRETYSKLINSLPNLTALNCQPQDELDCLTLIKHPHQIKCLNLCFASDTCSRLALNCFSGLTDLDLTHNSPEALSNETIQSLALPHLVSLNLSSNEQLTNDGIVSLIRFAHLTSLDISCCKNIGDESLQVLLQHLQFTLLLLNGCPKITESGLLHLASQKNLFSLSFGGSDKIRMISFMQSLTSLRTLFIEHSQLDETPDSLSMLTHLTKLVLLAIWDAPHVNDVAIATLRSMTHLINFQLSGSSIGAEGAAIAKQLSIKEIIWIG